MTPEELEAKKAALAQLGHPVIDPQKAAAFESGFAGHPIDSDPTAPSETTPNQQSFFQSLHNALLGPDTKKGAQ